MLLDAMLHLLEAAKRETGQGPNQGDSNAVGASCWWGALGSTQEEGLLVLTQFLQTMWDTGGSSVRGQDVEAERTLPARARTHPGLPSQVDVPTREEALARDNAAAVLGAIRKLVEFVWPAASIAAADSVSRMGQAAGYADWEVLRAEVLTPLTPSSERPQLTEVASMSAAAASSSEEPKLPSSSSSASASCCWGEGLWCFNSSFTNLSGPSELALQTSACVGGCGVRYCSLECQAQGWRDGHRLSCARLRARWDGGTGIVMPSRTVIEN